MHLWLIRRCKKDIIFIESAMKKSKQGWACKKDESELLIIEFTGNRV